MAQKVTWRQQRAIEALVSGDTKTQAAAQAGVSRSTLYIWLDRPEFRAELKRAETAALDDVSRQLVALSDAALCVFSAILSDNDAPVAVRLRAANWLLQRLIQWRELVDLEKRVGKLEQQMETGD